MRTQMNCHVLLTCMSLCGILCLSCQSKSHKDSALSVSSRYDEERCDTPMPNPDTLFEVRKVEVEMGDVHTYEAEIDYPVRGKQLLCDSVSACLLRVAGVEHPALARPEGQLKSAAMNFIHEASSCNEDTGSPMEWSFEVECELKENRSRFLTYHVEGYEYTGGAHGMPWNYHVMFDTRTGRTVKWKDVFRQDKGSELEALVRHGLQSQYGLDERDYLGDFSFPEHVAFTQKGVMVEYAPYEIACFAAGMPHCVFPFAQVCPFMTDYGLSLLR